MKKSLYLLIIAIILTSCVTFKPTIVYKVPEIPQLSEEEKTQLLTEHKTYDAIILDKQLIIEHYYPGYKVKRSIDYNSYLIINPNADRFTTFQVSSQDSRKVININLKVIYPNNESAEYTMSDCHTETNSDKQTIYKFAYPNITQGCIIQECTEFSTYGYSKFQTIPLQYSIPVINYDFLYKYPAKWETQIKETNSGKQGYSTTIDSLNQRKIISYSAKNIPGFKDETYSPSLGEMDQYLDIHLKKYHESSDFISTMRTEPSEWSKLLNDLAYYCISDLSVFGNSSLKTANEITKNCTTQYEKADSIVTFVQNNFTVADHLTNVSYNSLLKTKKGDPLKITGLTNRLLKEAGIESQMVLCHSKNDGTVDPSYISYNEFSEPGVFITIESKNFLVFPWNKYNHISYVPNEFIGQKAVIIDKPILYNSTGTDYSTKLGTIIDLPKDTKDPVRIKEDYELVIDSEGIVTVNETLEVNKDIASVFRAIITESKKEDIDKFIKNKLTFYDANINLISYQFENLKNKHLPLKLIIQYSIDNLVSLMPDEVIFQTNGLLSPASISSYKVKTEDRQNPISIDQKFDYIKNISISYPDTWSFKNNLNNHYVKNDFGLYRSSFKAEDNKIIISQIRSFDKIMKDKSYYSQLLDISGEEFQSMIPSLIFEIQN